MKLHEKDIDTIIDQLYKLARQHEYSKLVCKIPKSIAPLFLAEGFRMEAYIPKFYQFTEDMVFVSKFLHPSRKLSIEKDQLIQLKELLSETPSNQKKNISTDDSYNLRALNSNDVHEITELYRIVFESYPFPIHNPGYILKTINENVQYFGVEKLGKLVAIASAEIDFKSMNAEMTDFATHPDHKGKSLSKLLLNKLEASMQEQHIKTLYTIARLNSIPMNKTFIRYDYTYTGTLLMNTNIAGKIESMNVYYKHL